MSDKSALLREADEAFDELREGLAGLSEEAMGRVWLGAWGAREIVIHISGWHREAIEGFARVARGEPAPHAPGTYDDYDAWNARFVEARRGAETAEILAELETSHRDFLHAAAAVPEAHFATDTAVRGLFDGSGAAHYREHAAQIRAWRQGGQS